MAFTRMNETRMISRALIQKWPIDEAKRKQVISQLIVVLKDPNTSNRERLAACKGLIAAEEQNQNDELSKPLD